MNVESLKAEESAELEISYPNGAPSDLVILLRSVESPEVKKVLRKWDGIATRAKRGRLDFDQKEQANIDFMAAAISGWRGWEDNSGPIECTTETKRELLTNPATEFIRRQIDEKLGDVGAFLSISGK